MNYTNYTNLDSLYVRTYEPGDRLVQGWSGTVTAERLTDALETVFVRHNRDDRPDGQLCPSLSIGDVVVIGDVAYSVDTFGFTEVTIEPADLITDRTWVEVSAS